MNDWAELGRALEAMAASGAEVHEDGEWLAEFAGLRCELRLEGKNSLVHLWSGERNLTRRILRVKERSERRIVLEVQRFGRSKPSRLAFLRTDGARPAGRVMREQFRARLLRILCDRFPDAVFESFTAAPDLKHSFSGVYVRGCMRDGRGSWAVLAASPGEGAAGIDGILTFGIIWLDWMRAHAERHGVEGLRLCVPKGTSRLLRERALALSPEARTEILEFRERDGTVQATDSADAGNLESRLFPRREVESVLAAARASAERIPLRAPDATDAESPIETRALPGMSEAALCFRGLEFARWSPEGISFGLGNSRQRLSDATQPALERLVRQLGLHRSSLASETNHFLYRAAPERWLEAMILADPTRLDAQLDPPHLYSQVPALAAGDRGVLDLLGVTRGGRLVVIELKASEDIQLPVQAIDYWLRVRRHQREGHFQRHGYFAGVELSAKPPLVWLVAPALRFHPATDTLLKYLAPEIQITRIGLNENWRRGIKVLFRK